LKGKANARSSAKTSQSESVAANPVPTAAPPGADPALMWSDYRRGGFRAQRRGEQAVEAFQEADKIDQLPRQLQGDDVVYAREAEKFRTAGEILLCPAAPFSLGPGKEAISWDNGIGAANPNDNAFIVETLEQHPTSVAVGASGKRTEAVYRAGLLESALDAAESAQASNSIEKMLCHQMAAAHFTALRLLEQSTETKLQAGEVARFTNAAARMMDVYQNACLTLQKLKTRGTQRVLVQYQQVNVGSGGQALVAGKVGRGSRVRRRGSRKNGR
jgi:hypothetical protein